MRRIDYHGHVWLVREVAGLLGFEVARLPLLWIGGRRPLAELTDEELIELVRAELETGLYASNGAVGSLTAG